MNECRHITELLPWLLNGTLEPAEQAQARAHLAQCAQCRLELDETALAWTVQQQHVPAEALADYAFDRPLADFDAALLQEHVAACAACTEALALARESRRWAETQTAGANVKAFPLRRARRLPALAWMACLAGLLALGGLGGWLWTWRQAHNEQARLAAQERQLRERVTNLEAENRQLQQSQQQQQQQASGKTEELQARLRELTVPQTNVPLFDLYPRELARRSAPSAVNEITLPRAAQTVTLILNSQSPTEARNASLTIVNAQGASVWRAAQLTRQSAGEFTLSLPVEFLPPGRYTFRLEAQQQGRRVALENFELRLRRAER